MVSSEAQLGGDVGDVEWYSGTHSYAIVSDASYNSSLVSFNPATGAKLGTVRSPGGFSLPDCALDDRGELLVADNGLSTAGLYVYHAGDDALVAGPLDTGLPPVAIAFDAPASVAGVTPPISPGGALLSFAPPTPNPARTFAALTIRLARAGSLEVTVFDLAGHRVATLLHGDRPAGEASVSWSLTDRNGRKVRPGVYLVRAETPGEQSTRRVAVLN